MATFHRPEPGAVLGGDFRIVRPLKEGGMGSVYVAEQVSTGARRALKLMHPQFAEDATMRRRFDLEARAAARIESDYVVAVIAAGVDEAAGVPWIAMELLDGEELSDHVARRGRLGADEVLEIARMLCHAVAAAHDVGLVHRDLKPENLFLAKTRRSGEAWSLKVLDFGIARAADALHTSTAAVGTPLWMAPEQTIARGGIGPATDVWALGLIVYQLLTGGIYWRTAHDEFASIPQFLQELAFDPIEAASTRGEPGGRGPAAGGLRRVVRAVRRPREGRALRRHARGARGARAGAVGGCAAAGAIQDARAGDVARGVRVGDDGHGASGLRLRGARLRLGGHARSGPAS